MTEVVLRTGAKVPAGVVALLSLSMDRLMRDMPIAVHDLVVLARTGKPPFSPCAQRLRDALITEQDGSLHPVVRDVVLAMFEGDGLEIHRVDPTGRSAT